MSIVNSETGEVRVDYSVEELEAKAQEMRAWNMISLTAAGSGHTGGTMSIMDITAALYLKHIRHDPKNPQWPDRDRVKPRLCMSHWLRPAILMTGRSPATMSRYPGWRISEVWNRRCCCADWAPALRVIPTA